MCIRFLNKRRKNGIKIFNTKELMQADTTAKEGDLAVVYRSELKSISNGDTIASITFPKTVVFNEAVSSDYYGMLRGENDPMIYLDIQLNASNCFIRDMAGVISEIEYSSTDGITYTRTDSNEDTYEIGETLVENLDEHICKFMQIGGNIFEGLFQYKHHALDNVYNASNYSNNTKLNINYKIPDIIAKIDNGDPKQLIIIEEAELDKSGYYYNIKKCKTYQPAGNNRPFIGITADNKYYICFEMYNKDSSTTIEQIETNYDFSLDNPVVSTVNITKSDADKLPIFGNRSNGISTGSDTYYILKEIQANQTNIVSIAGPDMITTSLTSSQLGKGVTIITAPSSVYKSELIYIDSYMPASTQLTTVANDVYKSIFFGKNGLETGTLSENVSNSFADSNAEIYAIIKQAYNNMEPRVLTDDDKTIDKNIQIIPTNSKGQVLLDTSGVTNMTSIFDDCSNLKEVPLLDTSKAVDTSCMFRRCSSLKEVPLLDTSNVTDMGSMFAYCTSLKEAPALNTSKVTTFNSMFCQCTSLKHVPLLDTSNVIGMFNTFEKCTNLSDESLNNILAMCTNATKITSNKTLKYLSLTSDQATKCTTLSNYSAFTSAGWTTGY